MIPLHFCIAAAPLGVYLFLMGFINLSRRPFITTGSRDAAALGIGISGLIIAGPMELFFPESAAGSLGPKVWLMLIAFYGLSVSLVVLLMRPRLVLYNVSADRLRPTLAEIANQIDANSRWVGDCLDLPDKNVHLIIETGRWLNNVQLVSIGNAQSHDSWREIESKLRLALKGQRGQANFVGVGLMGIALTLAATSIVWMMLKRPEVAQAFKDLLRI